MVLLDKLNNFKDTTHSEAILIQFILNEPESFLALKPKEIATKLYISVATLYRLLEKLGYNGITLFKIDLASAIKPRTALGGSEVDINYPIKPSDTYREMSDNLTDLYTQTLQETTQLFNYQEIINATQMIEIADKITVLTTSSNIYFAQNFAFQMQEIGYDVRVPQDDFTQSIYAANSSERDVAIIISYGGRSHTLHKITQIIKDNNTRIILLTSTQENPLTSLSDLNIYMSSTENHYNKMSSFSSRLSLLYLLDTLYAGVFTLNYEKNSEFKKNNYAKINDSLE